MAPAGPGDDAMLQNSCRVATGNVVPWVTPDVRSTELFPRQDMSPGDRALRQTIRGAHRRGMSVLLLPIVYVDRMAEGEW